MNAIPQAHQEYKEYEGLQERILKMLGMGIDQHKVASAIGVEPSYISQLLADEDFKSQVQELKFANLTEATNRDKRYNGLEDKILDKIESDIDRNPLAFRNTMEKMKALTMVNGLKRRGAGVDENHSHVQQTTVQLIMPTVLFNRYVKSVDNQIVQAGNKDLLTMQSQALEELANEHAASLEISTKDTRPSSITFYE